MFSSYGEMNRNGIQSVGFTLLPSSVASLSVTSRGGAQLLRGRPGPSCVLHHPTSGAECLGRSSIFVIYLRLWIGYITESGTSQKIYRTVSVFLPIQLFLIVIFSVLNTFGEVCLEYG